MIPKDRLKHLGIRLDRETLDKIRFIADYYGRSINRHVLYLVNEDIRRYEREIDKNQSKEDS